MTEPEKSYSDFGAGIIVCLARFAGHLENRWAERIWVAHWWRGLDADEREKQRQEARKYPQGDSARRISLVEMGGRSDPDLAIDAAIQIWANAASDHFHDLADNAPKPLKQLAALTLRMGHGFHIDGSPPWTWGDWERVERLFRESCIELDRLLGADPDWGTW